MLRQPGPAATGLLLVLLLTPGGVARGHDFADARIEHLNQRIAAGHDLAALYVERAEIHRQAGQLIEADHDLAHARGIDPRVAGLDLVQAAVDLDADRPAQAIAGLYAYLAEHPEDGQGFLLRARARERLALHATAADDYDAAIQRLEAPRPDHFAERLATHIAMCDTLRALEGIAEGRQRLGTVMGIERAGLDLEVEMQDYDAALVRLDTIRDAFESPAMWHEWRGDVLRRAGRTMEALAEYSEALSTLEALPESRRFSMASRALESRLRNALNSEEALP